jgi:hypothetical protein
MPTEVMELEGTWEEILARSEELAGRRVHVTVLPESASPNGKLSERNQRMLAAALRIGARKLTPEEIKILDDFEQFRKDHPFSLRSLSDDI